MIGKIPTLRIAGYLEKRSKHTVLINRWKRWWFVLEGRLLLYYKSQIEYLRLSPCQGSVNMGIVLAVQHTKGFVITIRTTSQTITLRASKQSEHEQWLQSLLDAITIPNTSHKVCSKPIAHFRYANQDNHNSFVKEKKSTCSSNAKSTNDVFEEIESVSRSNICSLRRVFSDSRTIPHRVSDCSSNVGVRGTYTPVNERYQSLQELHNTMSVNSNVQTNRAILNSGEESKSTNTVEIEFKVEDHCSQNIITKPKIGTIKITCEINGSNKIPCSNDYIELCQQGVQYVKLNSGLYTNNTLSTDKGMPACSGSADNVQTLDRSIGSTYQDCYSKIEVSSKEKLNSVRFKPFRHMSHSFLCRVRDNKEDVLHSGSDRTGALRTKICFLRNLWKRSVNKPDEDNVSNDYESIPVISELPVTMTTETEQLLEEHGPQPEPTPDYDLSLSEVPEVPLSLTPQQNEWPSSLSHEVLSDNILVSHGCNPPPLPLKKKQRVLVTISCDKNKMDHKEDIFEGPRQMDNLDRLLAELSDKVQELKANPEQLSTREVDYDIPRPHVFLLAQLCPTNSIHQDALTATHFLCTTPLVDSLDPVTARLDAEVFPDSLECSTQWSSSQASSLSNSSHTELDQFFSTDDKIFPDSLN